LTPSDLPEIFRCTEYRENFECKFFVSEHPFSCCWIFFMASAYHGRTFAAAAGARTATLARLLRHVAERLQMASLFKPQIVRYLNAAGRRVSKTAPGARKKVEKSSKWYGRYTDANGLERRVPLCRDKAAAMAMLNELVTRAERQEAGVIDRFDEHRRRPLAQHIKDFKTYLTGKGSTAKHVAVTIFRLEALCTGCRFLKTVDLSGSAITAWLADQREADKLGAATSNYYLSAIKHFCKWMIRDRRMGEDPTLHLPGVNTKTDVRRERRPLERGEFDRLIAAARKRGQYRGLSGTQRALLYVMAANTGLRVGELASLTAASFDLAAELATVTVEAVDSKHRRKDVLPLRQDLVALLRPYIAAIQPAVSKRVAGRIGKAGRQTDQDPPARLWPGTWAERAARMIRNDLKAARLAWLSEATEPPEQARRAATAFLCYADDAGRVFDFHGLRHHFITNLAKAGVPPKVAQTLARHSTITLTLDRYSHVGISDVVGGLDALPPLPSDDSRAEGQTMQATGTDNARPTEAPVMRRVVRPSVPEASSALSTKVRENEKASNEAMVEATRETGASVPFSPAVGRHDSSGIAEPLAEAAQIHSPPVPGDHSGRFVHRQSGLVGAVHGQHQMLPAAARRQPLCIAHQVGPAALSARLGHERHIHQLELFQLSVVGQQQAADIGPLQPHEKPICRLAGRRTLVFVQHFAAGANAV
jgi:site-specific recombinase XerD